MMEITAKYQRAPSEYLRSRNSGMVKTPLAR
jgi:hypothetical protein